MQLTTRILVTLIVIAALALVAVIVLRPNHSIPPSTTPAGPFAAAPTALPATVGPWATAPTGAPPAVRW